MLLNNKYEYNPKTDLLGTGGFGRVYKARDTLLERDVALKMVNIEGAKAHYNLIEEIKKVYDFSHLNIIRYIAVFELITSTATGEEIKTQVGVMEYMPGGDISQLDWKNLGSEKHKDIILQILDGLDYLHQNRIIHRDIKPSNILIKDQGSRLVPKITDFGISKTQDQGSVSVSRVIGSIPYMAPEQFDSHGKVSYNTDFWSLGILVYHLFTGNLPFGDESTTSEGVIMKNIMEMPLPGEVQQIPMPFRRLVELCLVKDRNERVKEASALKEVLLATTSTERPFTGKAGEKEQTIEHEDRAGGSSHFGMHEGKTRVYEKACVRAKEEKSGQKPDEPVSAPGDYHPSGSGSGPRESHRDKEGQFGTFQDPRDGITYKWVRIGKQIWMAENLIYKPRKGNYWSYVNQQRNMKRYGYLYDWYAARNVCPPGWHLPSEYEWERLSSYVGSCPAIKLKALSGWAEGGNGTDHFGFSALPGGYRSRGGTFYAIGYHGIWWSSEEYSYTHACRWTMHHHYNNLVPSSYYKEHGFSVRCIKD